MTLSGLRISVFVSLSEWVCFRSHRSLTHSALAAPRSDAALICCTGASLLSPDQHAINSVFQGEKSWIKKTYTNTAKKSHHHRDRQIYILLTLFLWLRATESQFLQHFLQTDSLAVPDPRAQCFLQTFVSFSSEEGGNVLSELHSVRGKRTHGSLGDFLRRRRLWKHWTSFIEPFFKTWLL